MRLIILLAALLSATLARAEGGVSLNSQVFVERLVKDQSGRTKAVLELPAIVTPGDRLVFILNYKINETKSVHNLAITNPMPTAVAFQDVGDPRAILSVDGGQNWGRLAQLKKRETDGRWRSARPEDVTHIRWPVTATHSSGNSGKLSFRGVVR